MRKLTQERLKEMLDYNPDTGTFTWKIPRRGTRVNNIAGYVDSEGYRHIKIDYNTYQEHRLAWLYVHGYFPEHNVDHINRNKSDNRISNLREASHQCNARNIGNISTNTSGVKGVHWAKHANKWSSNIKVNGKQSNLGYYVDFDDAVCARLAVEQCLNWKGCNSSSPAYMYVKENILER